MTDHFVLELSAFASIEFTINQDGSISIRPIGDIYKNHPGYVPDGQLIKCYFPRPDGSMEEVNMPNMRFACNNIIKGYNLHYECPPEKPMMGIYDEARRAVGHPLGHYQMGLTRSHGDLYYEIERLILGERMVRLDMFNKIMLKIGRYVFEVHYASGREADSCLRLETLSDGTHVGYLDREGWPATGFQGGFLDPRFLIYSIHLHGEFDESIEWQEGRGDKTFWASMIARVKA
jgi:hypothetical protein